MADVKIRTRISAKGYEVENQFMYVPNSNFLSRLCYLLTHSGTTRKPLPHIGREVSRQAEFGPVMPHIWRRPDALEQEFIANALNSVTFQDRRVVLLLTMTLFLVRLL